MGREAGVDGKVSIHASAKEATASPSDAYPVTFVSIHASAKEATAPPVCLRRRPHVSIHASAKEATQ